MRSRSQRGLQQSYRERPPRQSKTIAKDFEVEAMCREIVEMRGLLLRALAFHYGFPDDTLWADVEGYIGTDQPEASYGD